MAKVKKEVNILSHNTKYLRKKKGISQEVLANRLGINRSNIAAYESKNVEPRLQVLLNMAKLFDVDLQTFISQKITNSNYPNNQVVQSAVKPAKARNVKISISNEWVEFIENSKKIRKVLEGFKAFYAFKRNKIMEEDAHQSKLLFDIDNFLQLMDHLLTYNESVINTIDDNR